MYILVMADVVRVDIHQTGRTMTKIKQMTRTHAANNLKNANRDVQHGNDPPKPLGLTENYRKLHD